MFNNKKGAEYLSYAVILELMILLLIAGAFSLYILSLEANTQFERMYLARDISLLVHAIYASPGEVEYEYYPTRLSQSELGGIVKQGVGSFTNQLREAGVLSQKIDLSRFNYALTKNSVQVSDAFEAGQDLLKSGSELMQSKSSAPSLASGFPMSYSAYHLPDYPEANLNKPISMQFKYNQNKLFIEGKESLSAGTS